MTVNVGDLKSGAEPGVQRNCVAGKSKSISKVSLMLSDLNTNHPVLYISLPH